MMNTENQKKPAFYTEKKENVKYWDAIDNKFLELVKEIALSVGKEIPEDNEWDIVKPIIDTMIEELELIGIVLPVVNEDY